MVGWDGFLALRSTVFVMHSDVEAEASGGHAAQPRAAQAMKRGTHRNTPTRLGAKAHAQAGGNAIKAAGAAGAGAVPASGAKQIGGGGKTSANLDEALHQAAAMGMAEYPEHLQVCAWLYMTHDLVCCVTCLWTCGKGPAPH